MASTKIIDILSLGLITGVVAILTSVMGISGTIIGSVVTSIAVELLKTFVKPMKEKIADSPDYEIHSYGQPSRRRIQENYKPYKSVQKQENSDSFINTKTLFIFPLIVILIIELIHFLGAIGIIPYDIFFSLEYITNWKLFRTIGYALIIMGLYPLFSKKLGTHHGIILIIIGIIELIIGYADTSTSASLIFGLFSSLKEFVNIAIILAILYTILTIPEEIKDNKKEFNKKHYNSGFRQQRHKNYNKYNDNQYNDNYYDNQYYNKNHYPNQKPDYKRNKSYENKQEDYEDYDDYYYYYEE